MISFALSSQFERTALLLMLFVALLIMLMLLFSTLTRKSSRAWGMVNVWLFFSFFVLLMILCTEHSYIAEGVPLIFNSGIPIWGLWGAVAVLLVYTVCGNMLVYHRRSSNIDRNSIREALDTLPIAVCYFTENDLVKLCNLQMYRLFYMLTQSDLQSYAELRLALDSCDSHTGVIRLSGDESVYLFPNGKAWLYDEEKIMLTDGNSYKEAVFYDVTELYEKRLEIETQTNKLKELGRNIRALSENVVAATKEEEMLSFKTLLHDRMSAGLVAARQILLQNRPSAELDELIRDWQSSVSLVKQDNDASTERGELPDLLRDAQAIGVNIHIDGELPSSGDALSVYLNAIRECLTNCVRHADGTELYIKICGDENSDTATITNDGKPPSAQVVPRGGLSNLIKRINYLGGTAQIQSFPRFMLTVSLPKKRGI